MSYADYFYVTSYPDYTGYRIEHDPTITAYCNLITDETLPEEPNSAAGVIALILIVVGIALLITLLFLIRRKK